MKSENAKLEPCGARLLGNLAIGESFYLPSRILHSEYGTFVTDCFSGVVADLIRDTEGNVRNVVARSEYDPQFVKYFCFDVVVY